MTIKLLLPTLLLKLDDATEADEVYRRAKEVGIQLELDKREHKAVEYGTVVQVGPKAFVDFGGEEGCVKVGDRVTLVKYSGKDVVDSDGTKYVIVNDQDVLAVIE